MRDCNSCGKCCDTAGNGGLSASAEEIDWWELHRPDIARYVKGGKIWVDPVSGDYLHECPWLQRERNSNKTSCAIYSDRPEDCRHYPVDVDQMLRHGCEMLEPRDLKNPRQAQKKLDAIMIESRPAAARS